jgi:hypothetical protein
VDERRVEEIRLCSKKYRRFERGAAKALRLDRSI